MKQAKIERLLPQVYQNTLKDNPLLRAILIIMESHHEPVEKVLEIFDSYICPSRAPDHFIPFLAKWVDLDRFFQNSEKFNTTDEKSEPLPTGQGWLRELIAAASHLSQWRGTAYGLRCFLEIAIGIKGFEIDENVSDENGKIRTFFFKVTASESTRIYQSLIRKIIEQEKPAYVSYELKFSGQ
jgi:phage tail-like protein